MTATNPANETVGPLGSPVDGEPVESVWGRGTVTRSVRRYRTTTERDLDGPPPDGAICWVAATRWTYWAEAGVWTPANALFSKLGAAVHSAFGSISAETILGTVTLAAPAGTAMRVRATSRSLISLSAASAAGDEWEYRLAIAGVVVARQRLWANRAGAQFASASITNAATHTAATTNPTVTAALARLTGTATAAVVADSSFNVTQVEYAAAHPF